MAKGSVNQSVLLAVYTKSFKKQTTIITTSLKGLENAPESTQETLQQVFSIYRCLHNIKGGASIISANTVADIAQHLENIYKILYQHAKPPSDSIMRITYAGLEHAEIALNAFKQKTALPFTLSKLTNEIDAIKHEILQPKK